MQGGEPGGDRRRGDGGGRGRGCRRGCRGCGTRRRESAEEPAAEKEEEETGEPEELDEAAAAAAAAAAEAAAKDAERQKDAEKMFDGENHGQVSTPRRGYPCSPQLPDAKATIQFEAEISDVNAALNIEGLDKGFFAAVQLREWRVARRTHEGGRQEGSADATKAKGDWKIWEKRTEEREEAKTRTLPRSARLSASSRFSRRSRRGR